MGPCRDGDAAVGTASLGPGYARVGRAEVDADDDLAIDDGKVLNVHLAGFGRRTKRPDGEQENELGAFYKSRRGCKSLEQEGMETTEDMTALSSKVELMSNTFLQPLDAGPIGQMPDGLLRGNSDGGG